MKWPFMFTDIPGRKKGSFIFLVKTFQYLVSGIPGDFIGMIFIQMKKWANSE